VVGGRSPGSRAYPSRLPDPPNGRSVAALARRDWHPRSQWRVRSGFTPASLSTNRMDRRSLQRGELGIEAGELAARALVQHGALGDQPACMVEVL
jgi:hypothetical protein